MAQRAAGIHVRDTGVDVHRNRRAILEKDLLEQHARDLARFDIGVWHEISIRPVRARPAYTQARLLGSADLDEDVPLARNLGLYAAAEGLQRQQLVDKNVRSRSESHTVMVSQSSAWTSSGRSFWMKNLIEKPLGS